MNITKTILAGTALLALLGTSLYADVQKGQKYYLKSLKSRCEMNGAKMAAQHTQDEWTELKEDGTLLQELITICPKGEKVIESEKFQKKMLPHIFDFLHEYGSDSGNVPSC